MDINYIAIHSQSKILMLLTNSELDSLVVVYKKIKADNTYQSPECYEIFKIFTQRIFNRFGFYRYPKEVLEVAELASILKAYKVIISFDLDRGNLARKKRGLVENEYKALYSFMELAMYRAMLSAFDKINKKQLPYKMQYDLDVIINDSGEMAELASLETEDIDAKIDAELAEKRRIEFEHKLDILEGIKK